MIMQYKSLLAARPQSQPEPAQDHCLEGGFTDYPRKEAGTRMYNATDKNKKMECLKITPPYMVVGY
jgi:hypothetical protein